MNRRGLRLALGGFLAGSAITLLAASVLPAAFSGSRHADRVYRALEAGTFGRGSPANELLAKPDAFYLWNGSRGETYLLKVFQHKNSMSLFVMYRDDIACAALAISPGPSSAFKLYFVDADCVDDAIRLSAQQAAW